MTMAPSPTRIVRDSSCVERQPQDLRPPPEDIAARNRMVEAYLPLVRRLCRRYYGSGEPLEDLFQVGSMGLVKAAGKYDPSRGVSFVAYATPVILGEIRNHLRDHGWAVKVSRKIQTQRLVVQRELARLSQPLGRAPSIREIVEATGFTEEEVGHTFAAAKYGMPESLDAAFDNHGGGEVSSLLDHLGASDQQLETLADRADLADALRSLNLREKRIIYLKYYSGLTQAAIARGYGISQMWVSRLQRRALGKLRANLSE